MATFNVSGSSQIDLTPTHQGAQTSAFQFAQMPFNIKNLTINATNYWRVQGSTFRFLSMGFVTKVKNGLRGNTQFAFDPVQLQNLQHVVPRMLPNNASHSFTVAHSHVMGRSRFHIKNHSFHFSSTGDATKKTPIALTGTSALSFAPTAAGKRTLKRIGTNALVFVSVGSEVPTRAFTGATSLSFNSHGDTINIPNPTDQSSFTFGQSNSVHVVKGVTATHSLSFTSGGFGLVY